MIIKKDILVLSEGPPQRLNDTTIPAEAKYSVSFARSKGKYFLSLQSLHCNGSNSFLFANAIKLNQFKWNDSGIKSYKLCLGYISKSFIVMIKARLNGYVHNFSFDNNTFDISNIINIHKHLMKKHDTKECLDLFKKCLSDN